MAHLVLDKQAENLTVSSWGEGIQKLGPLVYTLPASQIEALSSEELSLKTLNTISSPQLSYRQVSAQYQYQYRFKAME